VIARVGGEQAQPAGTEVLVAASGWVSAVSSGDLP